MSMHLDLNDSDVALLSDVIRSYLNDLHSEIVHTESYEFREALHAKQRRLQEIAAQLDGKTS